MNFRSDVYESDEKLVRDIVTSTGFFNEEEINIAVELVSERLQKGESSGYLFLFAEVAGVTVGYSCYGHIAGTEHSYDLYWIAVHKDYRGKGIGHQLLTASEDDILKRGGHRIYIETSSRAQYDPTRAFYLSANYQIATILDDFYAPGDSKYIFLKIV
ncbi:GNAT family N-acetyltransferase [candidate division KSB1 bacterium]|nr:GNAT family N-acetyltransferase [candidate division KSB1 bacterium]